MSKRSRDEAGTASSASASNGDGNVRPRKRRSRFAPAAPQIATGNSAGGSGGSSGSGKNNGASADAVLKAKQAAAVAAAKVAASTAAALAARQAARQAAQARALAVARGLPVGQAGATASRAGAGAGAGAGGAVVPNLAAVQQALAAVNRTKQLMAAGSGGGRRFGAGSSRFGPPVAAAAPPRRANPYLAGLDGGNNTGTAAAATAAAATPSSSTPSTPLPSAGVPSLISKAGLVGGLGSASMGNGTAAGATSSSSALASSLTLADKDGKVSAAKAAAEGVDPRLGAVAPGRRRRGAKAFEFVEPGSIARAAEAERERAERRAEREMARGIGSRHKPQRHDELDAIASQTASSTPGSGAAQGDGAGARLPPLPDTETPDVEWWDVAFLPAAQRQAREAAAKARQELPAASYGDVSAENSVTLGSGLVELPVPTPSVNTDLEVSTTAVAMMLTKKEQKRLRRQNRAERIKELRDKVARRLIAPPPPKIKLKNMMMVLGQQAVLDPTQVEAKVREETARRKKEHEMRNLARKLTPAERHAKQKKKMTATSTGAGVDVAVFRVKDMTHRLNKTKVDLNVRQLYITGVVLYCRELDINMVVAEGGAKAIKKFVRLMLHRIDWAARPGDDADDSSDSDSDEEQGRDGASAKLCELVWQGVKQKTFHNFRFDECNTAAACAKLMKSKNAQPYWDMVAAGVTPSSTGAERDVTDASPSV